MNQDVFTEKKTILGRLIFYIKRNLYFFIFIISLIVIIFGSIEYYQYQNINKIKNISKTYYQALDEIYNNELNAIELLNSISKTKSGFAILANIKLAEIEIDKKNYDYAYNIYFNLINDSQLKILYKDLIVVQASYNLFDNINPELIDNLLNNINIDQSKFKSHLYEIKFINSIDRFNKNSLLELYDFIQNDAGISNTVKKRIEKINGYLSYK